jgi:hypothetical protein
MIGLAKTVCMDSKQGLRIMNREKRATILTMAIIRL